MSNPSSSSSPQRQVSPHPPPADEGVPAPSATGLSDQSSSPTPTSAPSTSNKTNTGAIAGGVVGGLIGLSLLLLLGFWLYKRRRSSGVIDGDCDHLAALEKTRTTSPFSQSQDAMRTPTPAALSGATSTASGTGAGVGSTAALYDPPANTNAPAPAAAVAPIISAERGIEAEIDGREVDSDGVSVRSASLADDDMLAPRESGIPRLPMYSRGEGSDGRSSSRAL